nr:hypothetical protein [Nocardioides houyundeii]
MSAFLMTAPPVGHQPGQQHHHGRESQHDQHGRADVAQPAAASGDPQAPEQGGDGVEVEHRCERAGGADREERAPAHAEDHRDDGGGDARLLTGARHAHDQEHHRGGGRRDADHQGAHCQWRAEAGVEEEPADGQQHGAGDHPEGEADERLRGHYPPRRHRHGAQAAQRPGLPLQQQAGHSEADGEHQEQAGLPSHERGSGVELLVRRLALGQGVRRPARGSLLGQLAQLILGDPLDKSGPGGDSAVSEPVEHPVDDREHDVRLDPGLVAPDRVDGDGLSGLRGLAEAVGDDQRHRGVTVLHLLTPRRGVDLVDGDVESALAVQVSDHARDDLGEIVVGRGGDRHGDRLELDVVGVAEDQVEHEHQRQRHHEREDEDRPVAHTLAQVGEGEGQQLAHGRSEP